jgi:hypothetical protein
MPQEMEMKNFGFSVSAPPKRRALTDCLWFQQYSNTANEFIYKLPLTTTFGDGPFREVRLLVDGRVAGAAYPYATIFTGGIVPSAWR